MYFIGIDCADQHHDICIINDSAKELCSFRIQHNPSGFVEFINKINSISNDKEEFAIAVETRHGLLISAILDEGYEVYPINPKAVSRYRDRYRVSGAKTDRIDATVLANILRTDSQRFRPIIPDSELTRELKILTRDYNSLIQSHTRLLNKLICCLKDYYPLALNLFGDINSDIALSFLEKFPTSEEVQKLTKARLEKFLVTQGYNRTNKIDEIYNKIKSSQFKVEPLIVRTKQRLALALVCQLKALRLQLKGYQKAIEEITEQHPDKDIFESLPGAGEILVPRLIAEFGENRDRYQDFRSVQCEAGTAPITIASGKYKLARFRHACIKPFRDTLFKFAFCSLNHSSWAKEYYDKQRASGKTHSQAIRALSNKWAKIIFTMWKKRTIYDEAYHRKMQELHNMRSKDMAFKFATV